jgi:HEAT repeat protein
MAGGITSEAAPDLLRLVRTDATLSVRRMAIEALASLRVLTPDVRDFWVQSLSRKEEKQLRGAVLSAFRFHAQTDSQIIKLVIDALHDEGRFVRQEAIAAVTQIGRPAVAALPLRREIQESGLSDEGMRLNAEAAIRILSSWAANQ